MKRRSLYPLLIAAAGLAVYANSFTCPFIFDDYVHIVQDQRLRQPLLELLRVSSRPAVALSLALNHRLGGPGVWGYHAVNLAIHILAGLTLFGIARRTLEGPSLRAAYSGRAEGLAAAVALLWVVHPLQTQGVTYIIQRAESLMGLFYLLTLYSVMRAARLGNAPQSSAALLSWSIAAVLFCALGMASKAVMATAPIVTLLYDRIFLAPSWREILRRRGLLHLALFATWGILFLLFSGRAGVYAPEVGSGVEGIRPVEYALTQPGVILHYLQLSVWPHPLVLDYGWPLARTAREILPPLAAVGGVLAATGWALLRRPAAGFLGAWFFLILAPTSSFIPILDPAFEHRMYLPLAAVIAGAVLATARLLALTAGGAGARAGGALALTAVLLLGAATLRRNHDYRSFLSIWADTAWKRPLNPRARSNHGAALYLEGRVEEAIAEYREALRLKPGSADDHNNLACVLQSRGRHEEALAEFEEALRIAPRHEKAKAGLAMVRAKLGRAEPANPATKIFQHP